MKYMHKYCVNLLTSWQNAPSTRNKRIYYITSECSIQRNTSYVVFRKRGRGYPIKTEPFPMGSTAKPLTRARFGGQSPSETDTYLDVGSAAGLCIIVVWETSTCTARWRLQTIHCRIGLYYGCDGLCDLGEVDKMCPSDAPCGRILPVAYRRWRTEAFYPSPYVLTVFTHRTCCIQLVCDVSDNSLFLVTIVVISQVMIIQTFIFFIKFN